MDRRLHVTGIFFDLTKAYDVIDHNVLLDKLITMGSEGLLIYGLNLIYLTE